MMKVKPTGWFANICGDRPKVFGLPLDSRGFSLLELMAVMLIMFVMMGISTAALRGVMRGAGIRGGIALTRGVLLQARQQAMMQGRPVAVLLTQEDGQRGSMRTIMSFGKVAQLSGNVIVAENDFPWDTSELAGSPIYHFRPNNNEGTIVSAASQSEVRTQNIQWLTLPTSDEIAFDVGNLRELANGLVFDGLGAGGLLVVAFDPDGSARSDYSFSVRELGRADAAFDVDVSSLTGRIEITANEGSP